jgi:CDP-diacylglycerol--glycerol-3-phosphate 3-phosphatidyltransferase
LKTLKKNLPNLLSASRLILIIPFVMALAHDNYLWLSLITAFIVLSDYFDGFLARRLNAASDTGRILDPLADKICTAIAAIAMVRFRDFPVWLLVAMVVRDLLILLAGLAILKARRVVPVSDLIGRITMGMMSACFVIYLLGIDLLKLPSAYLTLFLMILTLLSYGRNYIKTMGRKAA